MTREAHRLDDEARRGALLQCGVELRVVHRKADLARELGEHTIVLLSKLTAPSERAMTMTPRSSPAWLIGATRSGPPLWSATTDGSPH